MPQDLELLQIIREEEETCAERIDNRIRPILLREFRLMAKKHGITRVGFIHGTCLLQREEGETIDMLCHDKSDMPEDLWRFASMCNTIADSYPTDDITTAD